MDKLMQLIAKKKQMQGDMNPIHAQAKHAVLSDLIGEMHGMDGDKVKGLKKVTVASDSPHGLTEGLMKAKQMVGQDPMMAHMAEGGIVQGEGQDNNEDMSQEDMDGETDMEPQEDGSINSHEGTQEDHEGMEDDMEESSMSDIEHLQSALDDLKAKIDALKGMQR